MDSHESKLLEGALQDAYMSMSYADMVIDCSDGSVPIHRCILASASPFLYPILKDYNPIESHRILIPDLSLSTMKHVISILYIGQTVFTSELEFEGVLNALKLLGIDVDPKLGSNQGWEISEAHVVTTVPEEFSQEMDHSALEVGAVVEEVEVRTVRGVDDDVGMEGLLIIHDEEEPPLPALIPTRQEASKKIRRIQRRFLHASSPSTLLRPSNGRQRSKNIQFKNRLKKKVSTETAAVMQEMLEAGQISLAAGPALRNSAPGDWSYEKSEYLDSNASRPDDTEEWISPEEILIATRISSQKDHAYATYSFKQKSKPAILKVKSPTPRENV